MPEHDRIVMPIDRPLRKRRGLAGEVSARRGRPRRWLLGLTLLLAAAEAAGGDTPLAPAVGSGAPDAPRPASAVEALDDLDRRTPLPLLPMMAHHQKQNMRDHLIAVQEIVAALAADDFAGVERAAGRIGLSAEMGQMCAHMGAGAPGFTEQALHFHRTADRIAVAARDQDRTRVLVELDATLQTCTACHAAWKQQIVDEPTWRRLTSAAPPPHAAPR